MRMRSQKRSNHTGPNAILCERIFVCLLSHQKGPSHRTECKQKENVDTSNPNKPMRLAALEKYLENAVCLRPLS